MTPLPILLALQYFSTLGTVLPKSFLGAFSSNSRLVRALSRYFGMKFLWLMASFRCNDNSDVIPTLIITNFHLHLHSFFFIRTSNFDAEAERSYIFWRFEAETFLKMFLNLPGIVFQPISADVDNYE